MFKLNEHIQTTAQTPVYHPYKGDTNETEEMPDRVRETYDYLDRVCNSLNACRGILSRRPSRNDHMIANVLEKAQASIMTLLKETGRLSEYEQWENSRSKQPAE